MSQIRLRIRTGDQAVATVQQARAVLARLANIEDVIAFRDRAEAIRHWHAIRGEALELQNEASEIRLWAERRAGELLEKSTAKGRPKKVPDGNLFPPERPAMKLKDLGVTKKESAKWKAIARIPEKTFVSAIEETKSRGKELSGAQFVKLGARQPKGTPGRTRSGGGGGVVSSLEELIEQRRRFSTIYADPPWRYENQGTRASTDCHYESMTVEEICAEPVGELVEEDAHLHLWVTNAFLFEAPRVMEAWGFAYKSVLLWVKPIIGLGNYWRVSHEFLLLGTRGSLPFEARDERSWVEAPRGQHSAKPDLFREKIERVSPGPYLELYGRYELPNPEWTVYGNQVEPRLF